jgi:dTDP-4-amino-4,6-dideoxygalactose transaminase
MIPIIKPYFGKEEEKTVLDIMKSGQITRGQWTLKFREEFKKYIGVGFCHTVCSGTAALYIALKAIGISKKEDIVIVPSLSFMATIDAVILAGGTPVVIDVDESYTMDPVWLEEAIKKYKPKAVIPVHLFGQTADMDKIKALCKENNVLVLEDAAQAHGAEFKGKKAGSLGDISAFSFYASKNVAMGEGGGIGYWQLKRLDETNEKRRKIAKIYNEEFKDLPGLVLPQELPDRKHVYHIYALRHLERNKIVEKLVENGIGARVYYEYTLHQLRNAEHLNCEFGELCTKELFAVPVHASLTESEVDYIVSTVKKIVKEV